MQADPPLRIDYLTWLTRVVGWDVAFPLVIGFTAAAIGWAFGRGAGVDIFALAGLPVVAFLIRLVVGLRQINSNACGKVTRGLQVAVLTFGLFAVAFLDFFVALAAFNPNNGVDPDEIALTVIIGTVLYLAAATFAMYPGRTLGEVDPLGIGAGGLGGRAERVYPTHSGDFPTKRLVRAPRPAEG